MDPRPQNQPLLLRIYPDPAAFEARLDKLIAERRADKESLFMTDLEALTECSLRTVERYLDEDQGTTLPDAWLAVLKRAWREVKIGYERGLQSGKPVGSIFALKNMGLKDTQEISSHVTVDGGEGLRGLFAAVSTTTGSGTLDSGGTDNPGTSVQAAPIEGKKRKTD